MAAKKIKGFQLKVKSFQTTATYQKQNTGKGSIRPSPPPPPSCPTLYHGGGMNLRVRQRVKTIVKHYRTTQNVLRTFHKS